MYIREKSIMGIIYKILFIVSLIVMFNENVNTLYFNLIGAIIVLLLSKVKVK